MLTLRIAWPLLFGLLIALAVNVVGVLPTHAQDQGFPPWPIIYSGTVEVGGVPLSSGVLTARVGDWTSAEITVTDGEFRCADPCLVLGPPTFEYVGAEVTFHLNGVDEPAELRFKFPALGEPSRRTEALVFSTTGDISMVVILIGLGLAVAVAGGVVALMFKGEKDSVGA